MEDFTLKILLASGIVSLVLGLWFGAHPEVEWIEGFAICMAVFIVVIVTGINDY